jgi:hypothetical protein
MVLALETDVYGRISDGQRGAHIVVHLLRGEQRRHLYNTRQRSRRRERSAPFSEVVLERGAAFLVGLRHGGCERRAPNVLPQELRGRWQLHGRDGGAYVYVFEPGLRREVP